MYGHWWALDGWALVGIGGHWMKHIASFNSNVSFLFVCLYICNLLNLHVKFACFVSSTDSILHLQVHVYLIQLCHMTPEKLVRDCRISKYHE